MRPPSLSHRQRLPWRRNQCASVCQISRQPRRPAQATWEKTPTFSWTLDAEARAEDHLAAICRRLLFLPALVAFARSADTSAVLSAWVGERVVNDLRATCSKSSGSLFAGFFNRSTMGDLLTRVKGDTGMLQRCSASASVIWSKNLSRWSAAAGVERDDCTDLVALLSCRFASSHRRAGAQGAQSHERGWTPTSRKPVSGRVLSASASSKLLTGITARAPFSHHVRQVFTTQ